MFIGKTDQTVQTSQTDLSLCQVHRVVVVLGFYVPSIAKVIWRWDTVSCLFRKTGKALDQTHDHWYTECPDFSVKDHGTTQPHLVANVIPVYNNIELNHIFSLFSNI